MTLSRPILHWVRVATAVMFWPMLAFIVWGQLSPQPPDMVAGIYDKYLHFIAYFGLGAVAAAAVKTSRRALWAALALVFFGGVMEILQGWSGRDASMMDQMVNVSGIVSGSLLARLMIEPLRRRFVRA